MSRTRLKPEQRQEQILIAALDEAVLHGYRNVTRENIARRAGVAPGLVSSYFGTMVALRRDIMRAAVHRSVLAVIAQGLAARDTHAMKAPEAVRIAALATLAA